MIKKMLGFFGMKFIRYSNPEGHCAGWLGWIENKKGKCLGFIHTDGRMKFDW